MTMEAAVESPQLTAAPPSEDTAAPLIETPPIETTPVSDPTATASAPEPTATEDPLATFEEDALRNSPRVKALLEAHARDVTAGVEGRHKQEVEAAQATAAREAEATAYQQRLAEAQSVDNGAAVRSLYAALDAAIDHDVDPGARERLQAQMPVLSQMAETLTRSTQTRVDRQQVDYTNAYLEQNFPDYRIAPDVVGKFDEALVKGDFKTRTAILMDIVRDAAVAAETPRIRRAAAADLKKEADAALKLSEQRANERATAGAGGPTAVGGRPTAIGNYRSLAEVAEAHVRGELTNAQVRAFRAMPRSQMPEY